MIYQDVYSGIKSPISMYDIRKQVDADRLAEQQKQLALQQKARTEQEAKAKVLYASMTQFGSLSEDKQSAMYQTYRQKWESLMPEAKGVFPSVWDSKDPTNKESLGKVISFLEPLVPAEEFTLGEGQVRYAQRPGGQPTIVARGGEKGGKSIFGEEKVTLPDGSQMMVDTVDLPSGSRVVGDFVKDRRQYGKKIPVAEYFQMYPDDWPSGVTKPSSVPETPNALGKPPTAPQPVPNQIELPPRNFNAPSPTNQAGETNVGYGIDENAMLQQPQIMPSMGNMMLKGADAVMADEFAPQPRNALGGGLAMASPMGMVLPVSSQQLFQGVNMLAQEPGQFAELMPAGSAPNRFGSPGVEGMEYAATGGYKQEVVPGGMRFSGPPRPTAGQQPPETSRDMTAEEIVASGRDPAEFSGQITSLGEKKFSPIPLKGFTKTQLDKMQQELENLKANAKTEAQKADVSRKEKLFVLRNLKEYEYALQKLENNPMFDTGPIDQFVSARTPLGQQIVELGTRIEPLVRKVQRTPGDPAAASETAAFGEMLPKLNKYLQNNFDNLNKITQYYLDLYGANAMVNSKSEYDALYSPDQDIVYIDLRDGKRYVKPKGKK